jgi:hypothetical protein
MAAASLVFKTRDAHAGGIVEIVVWSAPRPVPPSEHGFKYRLVFVRNGPRIVAYDNERGKGDHRHLRDNELPYAGRTGPLTDCCWTIRCARSLVHCWTPGFRRLAA